MMSKALQIMPNTLPIGSLEAYIQRANATPILTLEEEQDLARRLYYEKDLEAARELIMAHLRFVIKVARNYLGYGLPHADLIQEGNIGLMKAVKRFNPEMGVRLVSFAVHWIKAEIHEYILRNWRIVKVATTKAQRKLFFNLRKATKQLNWFTEEEAQAIAKDLNVSAEDVRTMESRMSAHDEAFDSFSDDSDDSNWSPENYLEDQRDPASLIESKNWSEDREGRLHDALASLDARSRDILFQRWLAEEKATLHDLAAKYSISAERVRQIEQNAMDKIKSAVDEENS